MPLSQATARQPMHERRITCSGYLRDDGLWDIEGRLVDTKGYDFDNHERGTVTAGEHVHEMWVRLTVDDGYEIKAVETATDFSPFGICGDGAEIYQKLVGLRVAPGWNRKVRELVGGVRGCTHIVEMLGPLGTVVFQTVRPEHKKRDGDDQTDDDKTPTFAKAAAGKRPRILNTCHALATTSPVVKRLWPAWYEGDERKSC